MEKLKKILKIRKIQKVTHDGQKKQEIEIPQKISHLFFLKTSYLNEVNCTDPSPSGMASLLQLCMGRNSNLKVSITFC